jgi:superfamily II DNA helicase RecQ
MQLRFFTIPVVGGDAAAEDLNRFLASHRVLAVDRQVAPEGAASVWAICVSYEPAAESAGTAVPRRGKVDYKEVLSEADFVVYAALRTLRKELAERDGVPVYSLFTNEQLAEMVLRRACSPADLREIAGIGEARVEKYGEAFVAALARARSQGDTGQARESTVPATAQGGGDAT